MRVHIELRRKEGRFIPRYRPQAGVQGMLLSTLREVDGRLTPMLYLTRIERVCGNDPVPSPELYAPEFLDFSDDEFKLKGFEIVDLRQHVQEWDVKILPDSVPPQASAGQLNPRIFGRR